VAVAGLGFGEQVHLPALAACALTEPVALWHPRAERLEQACAASGLPAFSVGDRLRILPNHACATAAQHGCYEVVAGSPDIIDNWERFSGW
jgi:hypothetical protein